mgnify:CR=1 FL=1
MLENFAFGIKALAYSIAFTVYAFLHHPVLWGFAIGFGASTLIHAFIVSDNPRAIKHILTKPAPDSFKRVAPRLADGTYCIPYSQFQREYNRVRIVFYSAFLVFLGVIGIALLRY